MSRPSFLIVLVVGCFSASILTGLLLAPDAMDWEQLAQEFHTRPPAELEAIAQAAARDESPRTALLATIIALEKMSPCDAEGRDTRCTQQVEHLLIAGAYFATHLERPTVAQQILQESFKTGDLASSVSFLQIGLCRNPAADTPQCRKIRQAIVEDQLQEKLTTLFLAQYLRDHGDEGTLLELGQRAVAAIPRTIEDALAPYGISPAAARRTFPGFYDSLPVLEVINLNNDAAPCTPPPRQPDPDWL